MTLTKMQWICPWRTPTVINLYLLTRHLTLKETETIKPNQLKTSATNWNKWPPGITKVTRFKGRSPNLIWHASMLFSNASSSASYPTIFTTSLMAGRTSFHIWVVVCDWQICFSPTPTQSFRITCSANRSESRCMVPDWLQLYTHDA